MIKTTIEDILISRSGLDRYDIDELDLSEISDLAGAIRDAVFLEMKQCLDNVLETRFYGIPG